jgi:solute:Na+ symporter, SSS family
MVGENPMIRSADSFVIITYFITMVFVGLAYSRRMPSLEDYFAGGRQLSWWLGGISLVMGTLSAFAIVVYAALGYQYGLVALTIYWTFVPGTLLATYIFAQRWRRAGVLTPTEFLETRFTPSVRQVFVWSGIPFKIIDEALKIMAIGVFVSAGLKISPVTAMLAVGIIAVVYTVLGGLWAVVVTDLVQFVLVATGVILLLPLTLKAAGGWGRIMAAVPKEFFHPVRTPYTWIYIGSFCILSTLSMAGNWTLIQRFYSARSDRECRSIGWVASALFFVLPPTWILAGMFARAFIAPYGLDPQSIYARLSASLLPPGMFGLMVAALFAVAMSVISSGYNVTAAVLTVDVHQRLIHPTASPRELMIVGRLLTTMVGLLALIIALVVAYFRWPLFDIMVGATGFFVPPTVLPMLAGLLSKRLSAAGVIAGFSTGMCVGLLFFLYRWIFEPANLTVWQSASIVVTSFATVLVLGTAAHFFPVTGEAVERSSKFLDRLNRPAASSEIRDSPVPIAGLALIPLGLVLLLVGGGITTSGRNVLTLGVGILFCTVGLALKFGSSIQRNKRCNTR